VLIFEKYATFVVVIIFQNINSMTTARNLCLTLDLTAITAARHVTFYMEINHKCTRSDNEVRALATMCLPCQQWTETSVWFDDAGISAFHSCVVDLWHLSLSDSIIVGVCFGVPS
jgi:hypothetical protein